MSVPHRAGWRLSVFCVKVCTDFSGLSHEASLHSWNKCPLFVATNDQRFSPNTMPRYPVFARVAARFFVAQAGDANSVNVEDDEGDDEEQETQE